SNGFKPHTGPELYRQMPQSTDAKHSDSATGTRTRMTNGVEGGYSSTSHWGCCDEIHPIWNSSESRGGNQNPICPSPWIRKPRNLPLFAVHLIASSTGMTIATTPAKPADRYAITNIPAGDSRAGIGHGPCDLMSRRYGMIWARIFPSGGRQVCPTDTRRHDLHCNPARFRSAGGNGPWF